MNIIPLFWLIQYHIANWRLKFYGLLNFIIILGIKILWMVYSLHKDKIFVGTSKTTKSITILSLQKF